MKESEKNKKLWDTLFGFRVGDRVTYNGKQGKIEAFVYVVKWERNNTGKEIPYAKIIYDGKVKVSELVPVKMLSHKG